MNEIFNYFGLVSTITDTNTRKPNKKAEGFQVHVPVWCEILNLKGPENRQFLSVLKIQ